MSITLPAARPPGTSASGFSAILEDLMSCVDGVEEKIEAPKTRVVSTLTAKARLNKATLETLAPSIALERVKTRLYKDLMDQLMKANAINIDSSTNPKNGATTFTATLRVIGKE